MYGSRNQAVRRSVGGGIGVLIDHGRREVFTHIQQASIMSQGVEMAGGSGMTVHHSSGEMGKPVDPAVHFDGARYV